MGPLKPNGGGEEFVVLSGATFDPHGNDVKTGLPRYITGIRKILIDMSVAGIRVDNF